jgi:hypothetical protein
VSRAGIFRHPSILRNLICPLATRLKSRTRWETHSFADYFSQMRPVSVQVSKKLRKRVAARKKK